MRSNMGGTHLKVDLESSVRIETLAQDGYRLVIGQETSNTLLQIEYYFGTKQVYYIIERFPKRLSSSAYKPSFACGGFIPPPQRDTSPAYLLHLIMNDHGTHEVKSRSR